MTNMRFTLVWWLILFSALTALMFFTAEHKTIVIADGANGENPVGQAEAPAEEKLLQLENTETGTGSFSIPLAQDIKADQVTVENCYLDRELRIFIKGAKEAFYEGTAVCGDTESILEAGQKSWSGGVLLQFRMDGIYEYHSSMESNALKIRVCPPDSLYKMNVVVDPVCGTDETQAELALEVSRLLPGYLENQNIKLWFTRTEKGDPDRNQCQELIEEVKADIFIQLCVSTDENPEKYGICGFYNEVYFIPEFGNVQLADILTKSVTISCGNRAVGLVPAEENSILQDIRIPAAAVSLGYLSNEKEASLLDQNAYREKLAKGVAEAIQEVYTEYYE